MRLRYRVLGPPPEPAGPALAGTSSTGPPIATAVDVEVEAAADATVGEVADAVASHLGLNEARRWSLAEAHPHTTGADRAAMDRVGTDRVDIDRVAIDRVGINRAAAIRTPAAPRDRPARTHAPRSGSTVLLCHPGSGAEPPAPRSPASLQWPDGTRHVLAYGPNEVEGSSPDDSPVLVTVDRDVVVTDPAARGKVAVDGVAVLGSRRVAAGAVIDLGRSVAVLRMDGPLRPPASGPLAVHRPVFVDAPAPDTETPVIELPAPPSPRRRPGLPLLTAGIPVVLGLGLWAATGSGAVLFFVAFSVVFVIASGLETRREARSEARFTEEQFRTDLTDALERLRSLHAAEAADLDQRHPQATVAAGWIGQRSPRLWERRGLAGEGFALRLGTEFRAGRARCRLPESSVTELRDWAQQQLSPLARPVLPLVVDLGSAVVGDSEDAGGALALVGRPERVEALARSLVLQACCLWGPDRLHVELVLGADRIRAWRWAAWLPHRAGSPAGEAAPRMRLIVVDGAGSDRAAKVLERIGSSDTSILWFDAAASDVPEAIRSVAHLDGDGRDELCSGGTTRRFSAELSDEDLVERSARLMAGLCPPTDALAGGIGGHRAERAGLDGARVPLGGILDDPECLRYPARLIRRWQHPPPGLSAPIGTSGGALFSIDLRRDGPHGVVAGTTGSGKSELLRTLIVSTALHHPPDRVTFLLVDYKGGTAFADLTGLPHTVGVVTDLTPALARRVLVSLRAELRRREADEVRSSAADADGRASQHPALVVVVDEFATLAEELPEFVEGLVDVARRGRSLGIHLLLATQRPAGVVTDAIRANTSLRVALRVADDEDGLDVVGSTLPAHFSREAPGRAMVKIGAEAPQLVQTAHCGGEPWRRTPASCRALLPDHAHDLPRQSGGVAQVRASELELAVTSAQAAAQTLGLNPPRRPWTEPLPDEVALEDLPAVLEAGAPPARPGAVLIGVVDRPEQQARHPLVSDLEARGGLLVLGASGSGRTQALRSLAVGALSHPVDPMEVWCIDGGRGLADLANPTGDATAARAVVFADDAERTLRLLRMLHRELRARLDHNSRSGARGARQLLVVDDIGNLVDVHEAINRGEALDILARLITDGRSLGIHVGVSARRRSDVPVQVLAGLEQRIVLRCSTAEDAEMFGGTAELADPSLVPGRGACDGHMVQIARAADRPAGIAPASTAVPPLPASVSSERLAGAAPGRIPLGVDLDDLEPVSVELSGRHLLIAGPPRSGRSTVLDLLAEALPRSFPGTDVIRVDGTGDPADALARLESARDRADSSLAAWPGTDPGSVPGTIVLIDDALELLEGDEGPTVDGMLAALIRRRDGLVSIALVAEVEGLARCYAESAVLLRRGRTGILLQPEPDVHGPILGAALPRRDELPAAYGRGWLIGFDRPERPGPIPVQLAQPV